ncbi:hypothetical protein [Streptomyces mirabilis]|uniref:hypothetical protein n=1 Tax=Streptomyces mirabilis TaxID=68239 RepID=UPI0033AA39E3
MLAKGYFHPTGARWDGDLEFFVGHARPAPGSAALLGGVAEYHHGSVDFDGSDTKAGPGGLRCVARLLTV